MYKEIRFRK